MAEISSINIPSGESYELKDNSAVADIDIVSNGVLRYTFRDGTSSVMSIPYCSVSIDDNGTTLYITTNS